MSKADVIAEAWVKERSKMKSEIKRLRKLLEEVAGSTFDGPMRAKINAELRKD